ncbi:MAG TPA: sulfotransferase [Gemmataceae bacterium]|nr:sulfotransferase [Gemmataceae bacterium]
MKPAALPAPAPPPRKKEWSANLWLGCDAFAWGRMLVRNRFAVHRSKWRVAAAVTAMSLVHTALRLVQAATYGRQVARTPVRNAPLFILGHWRAGTTLLHELLACDPRHAFPTTYECFAPHHFLITRSWWPQLFGWLMPRHRPMDNVAVGWERPQEDEFALCMLGEPSPYARTAFPNRLPDATDAADPRSLSPPALRRWKHTFYRLIQQLTCAHRGRRLILKSPPHTFRIPMLLELFPDARFVHIIRNPYAIYPSTLNQRRLMYCAHGFQQPDWEGLQEYILDTFVRMYDRLEEGKRRIAPGRFHELRYEDLVRDPLGRLEAIYRELDLGDFAPARPHVEEYLVGVKDYQTNRYVLTVAEQRAITRRWGDVIRRYGYTIRTDGPEEGRTTP